MLRSDSIKVRLLAMVFRIVQRELHYFSIPEI